jgi:hypothetical protein
MLDSDLALLYGVPPKVLNQAVKRNLRRFPDDFSFILAKEEAEALRSQIVTLKAGRGQHRKHPPRVFTEHGAIMAAGVLNSPWAVDVSVYVVRAFVRLRELAQTHGRLAQEFDRLSERLDRHDDALNAVMQLLGQLLTQPTKNAKKIGFKTSHPRA